MRKKDIRTIGTTAAIKDALLDMVYNDEEITVISLTKKSQKSRNTFYIHYSSIDDVITEIEYDVTNEIIACAENYTISDMNENPEILGQIINEVIIKNERIGKLIFSSDFSISLLTKLIGRIVDFLCEEYDDNMRDNNYARSSINFLVAGLIFSVYDWYQSDDRIPIDDVINRLGQISRDGLKSFK